MPLESKKSRIILFFVFGLGLALLMAGLKSAIAWAADTYLYSVPWVGGFLRSIELLEISNLLIFAILGVGIGAATVWLPRRWNHRAKLSYLLLLSPFVFSASYMMQQNLWIKAVATKGNIPYREARSITNVYLEKEVGSGGFFGFYPFSTQLAELPTRLEVLQADQSVNPSELLSQELSSYDDPRADMAAYVFERVGWLIRFMYMTIAALTGLIYYFKGHAWAENRSLVKAGAANVPSRATPRKASSTIPKASSSQRPNPYGSSPSKPSGKPISKPYSKSPPDMPLDSSSNGTAVNGSMPKPPRRPSPEPKRETPKRETPNRETPNRES